MVFSINLSVKTAEKVGDIDLTAEDKAVIIKEKSERKCENGVLPYE